MTPVHDTALIDLAYAASFVTLTDYSGLAWDKPIIFDIGMLLVRQHAIVIYLQCHPDAPERPELCFVLDEIRQSLTGVFTHYKLHDAIAKLPVLPLPGAPDSWKTWSGDALRDTVVIGLGGSPE